MKKVILSAVLASLITMFGGCEERKNDWKKPDINRPGDTKRFENF